MRKFLFLIALFFGSLQVYSQQADSASVPEEEPVFVKPDNSDPLKIGIKIGVGYARLTGDELKNPSGRIGINGGVYLRYRFKSKLCIVPELGVSFRGSNFNNEAGEYSSIRLYYIDLPVMMMYPISSTGNNLVIGGLQYSYLLHSSMFVSTDGTPLGDEPAFNRSDILAACGMQFNTPFVGFQFLLKYGLLNMNANQTWPINSANSASTPTLPPNGGGTIHNFIIELNLLF
ncbi:MAG: porin family protein [Bacteroidia bacterium]